MPKCPKISLENPNSEAEHAINIFELHMIEANNMVYSHSRLSLHTGIPSQILFFLRPSRKFLLPLNAVLSPLAIPISFVSNSPSFERLHIVIHNCKINIADEEPMPSSKSNMELMRGKHSNLSTKRSHKRSLTMIDTISNSI